MKGSFRFGDESPMAQVNENGKTIKCWLKDEQELTSEWNTLRKLFQVSDIGSSKAIYSVKFWLHGIFGEIAWLNSEGVKHLCWGRWGFGSWGIDTVSQTRDFIIVYRDEGKALSNQRKHILLNQWKTKQVLLVCFSFMEEGCDSWQLDA